VPYEGRDDDRLQFALCAGRARRAGRGAIVMELKDGLSPGIIKSFEEEGSLCVIMPMGNLTSYGGRDRVLIQWITIVEFRSYSLLSSSPTPASIVLSGPNAQGKTNLLEAMGLLLVGRSFRGAKAADLPAWGATGASLSGAVVGARVTRGNPSCRCPARGRRMGR